MRFLILFFSLFFGFQTFAQTAIIGPALVETPASITSAGGTTTLTKTSQTNETVTGTLTQTVKLPDATTLVLGRRFVLTNASTGSVTFQDNSSSTLYTLITGQTVVAKLRTNGTAAGVWDLQTAFLNLADTSQFSGTLGTLRGGTGLNIAGTSIADGDLLIGSNAGDAFVKSTLTAGTGITITNGTGSITIATTGGGAGTVTSVDFSVPSSSIFSVTGNPITTSGTINLLTTGTSGGMPYFSSTSQLSSSALLTNHAPMIGGGAGAAPKTITTGTSGQILQSAGSGADAGWTTATYPSTISANTMVFATASNTISERPFIPPIVDHITSGSGNQNKEYAFIISSGSATVGATYTNNSVTFTVHATVSSATLVYMSGSGAPTASGTLTKATGTGDATLTFSLSVAPTFMRATVCGGGGGGGGSSTRAGNDGGTGGTGGTTTLGSTLVSCTGGTGGAVGPAGGGSTGTCTLTGVDGTTIPGAAGSGSMDGDQGIGNTARYAGGQGGGGMFGSGGGGGAGATAGGTGSANSGNGGGGGGGPNVQAARAGSGGGQGGCVKDVIVTGSNLGSTIAFAIGSGGTSGAAGTGPGFAGGTGAAGREDLEWNFQ